MGDISVTDKERLDGGTAVHIRGPQRHPCQPHRAARKPGIGRPERVREFKNGGKHPLILIGDSDEGSDKLFGAVYVGWLLGYAIWLQGRVDGPQLVLFLVGVTWAGESAAYLVGSSVGRHRLAPILSPRKTLEGAIAQVIVSVAAALVLAAWLQPACSLAGAAGGGALLGVIGQVGDLAESAIKRSIGTKDTGGLIPGHGGMLDRIDSLLFNAPALYLYSLYAWCRA